VPVIVFALYSTPEYSELNLVEVELGERTRNTSFEDAVSLGQVAFFVFGNQLHRYFLHSCSIGP